MRVCLVNPFNLIPKRFGCGVYQPLQLAYLGAVLQDSGYDVKIIDALAEGWRNRIEQENGIIRMGMSRQEIKSQIQKVNPDFVGITVPFSLQIASAYEVASVVKEIDSDIEVCLGGSHPSALPEECLRNPNVDFVVVGEGEETVVQLVDCMNSPKEVKGIAYKKESKIVVNERRKPISDLNSIPFPARHLLPMETYFEASKELCSTRERLHIGKNNRWTPLFTSRGCPYNCVFCSAHVVMGRRWRERSAENVVDEIEEVIQKYRINHVDVEDDNFSLDKKRVIQICELILRRGLDFEWALPNGVRADTLDREVLKAMRKAGCNEIWVAPESGNQYVVNHIIGKKLDLRTVEKSIVRARKEGIRVGCFLVIGLLGETKSQIEETMRYGAKLKKLGANRFCVSIATPIPASRLFEQVQERGVGLDYNNLYFNEVCVPSEEYTSEWLIETRRTALSTLNKPKISKRLIRKIKGVLFKR